MTQLSLRKLNRRPLEVLRELEQRQGPVAEFHLGRQRSFYLSDPDQVARLFTSQAEHLGKWGSARRWWLRRPIYSPRGELLATHDREKHLQVRRALQPRFKLGLVAEEAARTAALVDLVLAAAGPEIEDVHRLADTIALSTAATLLCDLELEYEEALQAVELVYSTMTPWSARFSSRGSQVTFILTHPRKLMAAGRALIALSSEVGGRIMSVEHRREDALQRLVAAAGAKDIPAGAAAVLLAGVGPPAAPVLLTLVAASQSPLKEALSKEAEVAFAQGSEGLFERLPLARRVALEGLRLGAGWQTSRTCLSEFDFEGLSFRQGDWLLSAPYWIHRDPETYPNPEQFDPARWLPEAQAARSRHTFVPFGYAARKCLGADLALVLMTVTATVVARNWQLRGTELGWPWRANTTGELEPRTRLSAQSTRAADAITLAGYL